MRACSLSAAILAVALLGLAACGSSHKTTSTSAKPPTSAPAQTTPAAGGSGVSLTADPSGALRFDKSKATARAGRVTLMMRNPASLAHGVAITGNGVNQTGSVVGQGGTSTITVTLKPGTYTFYCPVPGHRQGGMQGTLTVR